MKNKLFNCKNLMQVSIYTIIAAIIFDEASWLAALAGILLIISSVLAMVEMYKNKAHSIKYLCYILLIAAGVYLLFE